MTLKKANRNERKKWIFVILLILALALSGCIANEKQKYCEEKLNGNIVYEQGKEKCMAPDSNETFKYYDIQEIRTLYHKEINKELV